MNNKKLKFDIHLLNDCIKKDNAELIGEYNKLNRDTIIKFKCNCGNDCEKNFRMIKENSGTFCNKCTKEKKKEKVKSTNLEKYGKNQFIIIAKDHYKLKKEYSSL